MNCPFNYKMETTTLLLIINLLSTIPLTFSSFQGVTQEEFEMSNIDILTEEAKKLPIEDLLDHPELLQHVDHVNKITLYRSMEKNPSGDERGEIIYERKSVDRGQMVVVLSSAEDNLKVVIRKRTYVVLRQNPMTNKTYFASYAYIRYSTDSNCAEWDGELRCVEWDTWDNSRGAVKVKAKYFGWTNCASSFLASCTFNESIVEDSRDRMNPSSQKENEKSEKENLLKIPFRPCPGYIEDDSIDVFADMDVDAAEAEYISKAIWYSGEQGALALLQKASKTAAGRSFADSEVNFDIMTGAVKEADQKAINKGKEKRLLKSKLLDRKKLLEQKNNATIQLMKIAKKNRLGSLWKVNKNTELMEKFRKLNGTIKLMEDIKDIERDLKGVPLKTDEDFGLTEYNEQLAVLSGADKEIETGELSETIGRALVEVSKTSPAGRSINSDTADLIGKSVAKSLLATTTDIFSNPGWKALIDKDDNYAENVTFFGFGSCIKPNISHYVILEKQLPLEVLREFYFGFLKTGCQQEVTQYFEYLDRHEYLTKAGNLFIVPDELKQLKQPKLNGSELQLLSSSFELSAFTKTFMEETRLWIYQPIASNGKHISRSVYFIVKLGLNFIQEARRKTPLHFIKLCRNLVLTLKMTFTKLLQDFVIFRSSCHDCFFEQNENDRHYIYGLMEFIIRALRPIELGENPHLIFPAFYRRNYQAVKSKANLYM